METLAWIIDARFLLQEYNNPIGILRQVDKKFLCAIR
jgi:hypothetical protein